MTEPAQRRYYCKDCSRYYFTWVARCQSCQSWEIAIELQAPALKLAVIPPPPVTTSTPSTSIAVASADVVASPASRSMLEIDANAPVPLDEVRAEEFVRDPTNVGPLDYVLGGGLVVGAAVVIAGEPGSGKSSCVMQALAGLGLRCLIATGEETVSQAADRARRIRAATPLVSIVHESSLERILEHTRRLRPRVLAIDSIQTLYCEDLASDPGSPNQVKTCTGRLVKFTKSMDMGLFIIGHVTNDGVMAGPRTLEHLVDVSLSFEFGEGQERIVRCAKKNRFGMNGRSGRFLMGDQGLEPIDADGWDEDFGNEGGSVQ